MGRLLHAGANSSRPPENSHAGCVVGRLRGVTNGVDCCPAVPRRGSGRDVVQSVLPRPRRNANGHWPGSEAVYLFDDSEYDLAPFWACPDSGVAPQTDAIGEAARWTIGEAYSVRNMLHQSQIERHLTKVGYRHCKCVRLQHFSFNLRAMLPRGVAVVLTDAPGIASAAQRDKVRHHEVFVEACIAKAAYVVPHVFAVPS